MRFRTNRKMLINYTVRIEITIKMIYIMNINAYCSLLNLFSPTRPILRFTVYCRFCQVVKICSWSIECSCFNSVTFRPCNSDFRIPSLRSTANTSLFLYPQRFLDCRIPGWKSFEYQIWLEHCGICSPSIQPAALRTYCWCSDIIPKLQKFMRPYDWKNCNLISLFNPCIPQAN